MVAPGCASKPSRRAGEEPEDHKRTKTSWQTGNLKMNEDLENPSRTCFVRGEDFRKKIF